MRPIAFLSALASVLLLGSGLTAQTCFGVPDNDPTTGGCNVIPFGSTDPTDPTWGNQKYQALALASELGSTPALIMEVSFAPCGTGIRQFDTIRIQLGHFQGTTLSTTFAANLISPVTVLDTLNYRWHNTASTWARLGLQRPFLFNGSDNVVIDVEVMGAGVVGGTGGAGMRSGSRQRVFERNWTTSPPAVGRTSATAALKMQFCTDLADISLYGASCTGSNQRSPVLTFTGTGQIGTAFSALLADAPPTAPAFAFLGFSNALLGNLLPLPMELGPLGAPGCSLYVDTRFTLGAVTDPAGQATLPLAVPNDVGLRGLRAYLQFFPFDPPANALGLTASNYGRILMGL